MWMKIIFSNLVFLSFCVEFGRAELLTRNEMMQFLANRNFKDKASSMNKCKPVFEGKLDAPHLFSICGSKPLSNDKLSVLPNSGSKKGFNCWESQLTETSRLDILDRMNKYRQEVANGTCDKFCNGTKRLVFELRWHEGMEQLAVQIIRERNGVHFYTEPRFDDPLYPEKQNSTFDFFRKEIEVIFGLQRELRSDVLRRLMPINDFNDWDTVHNTFRRSKMTEVGCAFMVQRGGAKTNEGDTKDLAHFACVFGTLANWTENFSQMPSNDNCNNTLNWLKLKNWTAELSENNLYPELCKIPLDLSRTEDPFMACQVPEADITEICSNASLEQMPQSGTTWKEKPYGYMLRLSNNDIVEAECNIPETLPEIPKGGSTKFRDFYCTPKHDVNVIVDVVDKKCVHWNCEESQLIDAMKVDILNTLNEGRLILANRDHPVSCMYCSNDTYCNMAALWHWFLEWKAAEEVRTCTNERSLKTNVSFIEHPFPEPVHFERVMVAQSDITANGHLNLKATISFSFWQNYLFDWSNDKKFRRANALWVGCAMIVKPNLPGPNNTKFAVMHLACIYAALDNNFVSKPGDANDATCCQANAIKNIRPYASLCTFAPSPSMSCQVQYCDRRSKPGAEDEFVGGYTIHQFANGSYKIVKRVNRNNPVTVVNPVTVRPKCRSSVNYQLFVVKFCWILIVLFILLLSMLFSVVSFIFKYQVEKESLKK